jgi:YggT family protein
MQALIFIVDTLFSLYIGVYLIRLLMQLVRADFRNQVAEGIVNLTNPLIMPLRRVLPPMGKLDTATVVAIVLLTAAKIAVLRLVAGVPFPTFVGWLYLLTWQIVLSVLWVLFWCIVLAALIGFLTQGARTPITALLHSITEPGLRPFRRYIPSFIAGFDLSYLWATIAIQALIILVNSSVRVQF